MASNIANRNFLHQFIRTFLCLPTSPKPNTLVKFRLADAFKPLLTNSLSPLVPSAWAALLQKYPGGLRFHLPMIFRFGAELWYEGPLDAFIISDNLASALEEPAIIDKKLIKDLATSRVVEVTKPTSPFISSLLGLVSKHNEGWQKIHHLSHLQGNLVNNHIPDRARKLRYTRFQEIFKLVIQASRHCIILKRNVKDAFQNVPVISQH